MYKLERNEQSLVKLTITVEGEEFKKARQEVMAKYKNAKVDGFRKGHVPTDIIEKEFAGNIREDLYQVLVNKDFSKALEENDLAPETRPEVISEEITKEKLNVEITFEVSPEFEMPEYKGIEVEVTNLPEVDEASVEKAVESVAARMKTINKVEREEAQMGDLVTINFEGFVDGVAFEGGKGENYDLKLGSKSFIDTFEEQIVSHKVDEEFEVNVVFPENYHAEHLKAKPAVFKVKIVAIKEEILPVIDDEFAKKQGFDTLVDYKTYVKSELEAQREAQVKGQKFQKIADKLVQAVDMVVPAKLLKEEKERELTTFKQELTQYGQTFESYLETAKKTEEEFEKDLEARATNNVKFRFITSRLIKEHNISVEMAEIDAELSKMGAQFNMPVETLKEEMKKMNLLENYTNDIANRIISDKIATLLVESSK